jgi:AraC-like DNA-binding protein
MNDFRLLSLATSSQGCRSQWVDGWHVEVDCRATWGRAAPKLFSEDPPDGLLLCTEAVDEDGVSLMTQLDRRGRLPPAAILGNAVPMGALPHFADVLRLGPVFVCTGAERDAIRSLMARLGTGLDTILIEHFGVRCEVAGGFLNLLARDRAAWQMPLGDILEKLAVGRSTFYRRLRKAGLPAPEQLQIFFKLAPGLRCIQRGGRKEEAAALAGYAEDRAFRRALASFCGMTISHVRRAAAWSELVDELLLALSGPSPRRQRTRVQ